MSEKSIVYDRFSCAKCSDDTRLDFDFTMAFQPIVNCQNNGYTDLMVDGAPSPHQPDTSLRWLIDRPRS